MTVQSFKGRDRRLYVGDLCPSQLSRNINVEEMQVLTDYYGLVMTMHSRQKDSLQLVELDVQY